MLRKQYQEKFFKTEQNNYEIREIENEFSLVSELFTELNNEIFNQQKQVDLIEDYVNESKESLINDSEKEIIDVNEKYFKKFNKYTFSFVGAGLGSLIAIYNPDIAIGSVLTGGIAGWLISNKIINN